MNKFEKLIEYIINDEDDKARQLFHTIVVEKSRDIYENIMAEEMEEEGHVHGDQNGDLMKELRNVDTEESTMESDEEEEEEGDEQPGEDDDTDFDLDGEDEDGNLSGEVNPEAGEHNEIEQQVMSANDKLDELLAKFDEIVGGHEGGMEEPGMEEPMDEMYEDTEEESKEEEEESKEEEEESKKVEESKSAEKKNEKKMAKAEKEEAGKANMKNTSKKDGKPFESRQRSVSELMREYVEKIEDINLTPSTYSEGDPVGAGTKTGKVKVNTTYTGLEQGPDFGGTSENIITKKGRENANPDNKAIPKPSNEYNKGEGNLPGAGKFKNAPGNKKVWDGNEPAYKDGGDGQGRETGKKAGAAKDGNVSVNKKSELGQAGQPTGKKI